MLIGFIVVIVMILVIVGLMATGNSGGGTGVNQTKATKVVSEIGTIAQSLSFYKTTTNAGNYAGFNQAAAKNLLQPAGYDFTDTTTTVDDDWNTSTARVAVAAGLAKSQAVPSVRYFFSTDSTNSKLNIDLELTGTDAALNQAVGSTVSSKLNGGNMTVDNTTDVNTTGTYATGDEIRVITQ